jgi:hypothetical protein
MSPIDFCKNLFVKAAPRDHFVQTYQDDDLLAEAVALYLLGGLAKGEPALVIATPAHTKLFRARLAADGARTDELERDGLLRFLDAETTLARILVGNAPDPHAFRRSIGALIEEVLDRTGAKTLRSFGEMVDLLWQRGNRDAALRLEKLWTGLSRELPFSLFCAYRIDDMDPQAYDGPLQEICQAHSHYIPSADEKTLEKALESTGEELKVNRLTDVLSHFSKTRHALNTEMPLAQSALFWFKEHMPGTAERIFDRIRRNSRP